VSRKRVGGIFAPYWWLSEAWDGKASGQEFPAALVPAPGQARFRVGPVATLRDGPYGDARVTQVLLDLGDRVVSVVEDRRAQHRVGARVDGLREVVELAGAARRDHRHLDRVGHGRGQREVVARVGAVAIHAREQDLPRSASRALAGPGDRFATRGRAPAG